MKKFSFELEGVFSIKQKLEGQAKINFGLASAKLNEEEKKRDELIARKNGYEDEMRGSIRERLDIKNINRLRDAIEIVDELIKQQLLAVKRAQKQVELARAKLNEAVRERKTIEKLKEKKLEEYMNEMNADEQKQINELVSYRHGRIEDSSATLRNGDNYGEESR